VALEVAIGVSIATDTHAATSLVWYGTATSGLILVVGLVAESYAAVQVSIALLGALFLLRYQERLLLAPLYGACLLLLSELSQRSFELRRQDRIGPGVIGSRLAASLLATALGACAAVVVALAVTIAPARSVAFTAAGVLALLAGLAGIVALARRSAALNSDRIGKGRLGRGRERARSDPRPAAPAPDDA
jgi:hypothetical protein